MPNHLKSNLASISAFQNIRKVFKCHKAEHRNKQKMCENKEFIFIRYFAIEYIFKTTFLQQNLSQVFSPKPSI